MKKCLCSFLAFFLAITLTIPGRTMVYAEEQPVVYSETDSEEENTLQEIETQNEQSDESLAEEIENDQPEQPGEVIENPETEEVQPEEAEPSASEEESIEEPGEEKQDDGKIEDPSKEVSETEEETGKNEPEKEDKDKTVKQSDLSGEEEKEVKKAQAGAAKGTEVTGTFEAVSGMDVSTIRYCWKEKVTAEDGTETEEEKTAFADFTVNAQGQYEYTFTAPCDNFESVQASETVHGEESTDGATVIAAYYDLAVWDGAVDVSWYDENASEYHLYTPAEFAGLAAIVNGSIDHDITAYNVKGLRTDLTITEENRGLPDCIECEHVEETDLGGPVSGPCYVGLEKNDFLNKTVYLEADLYMGGGKGTVLDTEGIYAAKANLHDGTHDGYAYYPNWTPIGGLFLSNVDDLESAVKAAFNGVLEGNGHYIYNLYCYRWSYPKPGTTAYGYADSTGVIGRLGEFYSEGESDRVSLEPAVRNLGLTGFVMGRRSVGGIVGRAGSGTYYKGAIYLENLANHATVYSTDSKGVAGIVGTFWHEDIYSGQTVLNHRGGSIINCYNTGNIRQWEYSGPAGGIVGQNDSANIFSCYNTGEISTVSKMGRGIGSNDAGTNYSVADCYYLDGHYDCDVEEYYGYYTKNADSSVSVTATRLNAAQMTNGSMLAGLNNHGTAYYADSDGYPILAWEAGAGYGTLTYNQPEGGTVSGSLAEGSYPAGTILYLSNEAEEGWTFRYYTLQDARIEGQYLTINGDTTASAFFQKSGRGYIEIPNDPICNVTVYRVTGTQEDGFVYTELKNGDEIVEGDELTIEATVKEGLVPDDPNLEYRAVAGVAQPFLYSLLYTGEEPVQTYVKSFTVTDSINKDGAALRIEVEALTTEKLWKNYGDVSWFQGGYPDHTEYTLTNAMELAGLDWLVEMEICDFSGVTITLGNDISLVNTDGSSGTRYWDGIGSVTTSFAGTFDGAGYKITDLTGCQGGLFAQVKGTADSRAVVKNVTVYGTTTGYNASGIIGRAWYTDILNCNNYCTVDGTAGAGSSYSGGILGNDAGSCVLTDCVNYAPVSGIYRVGGIVGESSLASTSAGKMTGCFNFGEVSAPLPSNSMNYVGGLAGVFKGGITACANYGNIRSTSNYTGGLVGYMTQTGSVITARMTDCYNVGDIFMESSQDSGGAGGLMGNAARFVLVNCFTTGTVARSEECTLPVGSFAGRYTTNDNNKTTNVYLLDTSCPIVVSGTLQNESGQYEFRELTYEEVAALNKSDVQGIKNATAAEFADAGGVLKAVNSNSRFVLTNAVFPELPAVAETHTHIGGTATCSDQAVCEECGLPYGDLDPDNHIEGEIRDSVIAEWMQDGYSGDVYCKGCGELLETGSAVPVDTSVKAITVSLTENGTTVFEKDYSVAEFDALKSTEAAGYQYGKPDGVSSVCLASNRYVTLEAMLNDLGYSMDQLVSATVLSSSSYETCSREILETRNLYVNPDGTTKTVPAAIGIYYDRQVGPAETVAEDSTLGSLIFMTGLSEEDLESDSVGGFRLIMPVESVSFEVEADEPTGLELSSAPVYTEYHVGENFRSDGIEAKVTYASGRTGTVGAYTIDKTGPLTPEDTKVTLSFRGLTADVPITVTDHVYDEETGKCTKIFSDGSACDSAIEVIKSISGAKVTLKTTSYVYSGSARKPAVQSVVLNGVTLKSGTDYTVSYKNNVNAGTGTVTVTGTGKYKGTAKATFKITAKAITPTVTLSAASYVYNAKVRKPTVTVKTGTKKLTLSTDYTVTYASGRKLPGLYKVTVKLKGNYSGSKAVYFKIVPKATTLKSLTAGSKKITVKWTKQATQTTGYQIQYSLSKTFASGNKTLLVKKPSQVSQAITGLKSGKTYYVRIRTYKLVSGKPYYSAWSAKKSVKVK